MNTSDGATGSLGSVEFRERDRERLLGSCARERMAWPYFNRWRKRDGGPEEREKEEKRTESRIPVKASVRQDILLAMVIVEMHVEVRHGESTMRYTLKRRMRKRNQKGGGGDSEEREEREIKTEKEEKDGTRWWIDGGKLTEKR